MAKGSTKLVYVAVERITVALVVTLPDSYHQF